MINISNVILFDAGKVLLGKRSLNRRIYPNSWAMFGGHANMDELPQDAAIRELREELDIGVLNLSLLHTFKPNSFSEEVNFSIFLCTEWIGVPRLMGDEHNEMHWFDIQSARNLKNLALDEYRTSLNLLLNN